MPESSGNKSQYINSYPGDFFPHIIISSITSDFPMEFYFPTQAYSQRAMHPARQQHAFYPQFDDMVFFVEKDLRQQHHRPADVMQSLLYQSREQEARRYLQQQREHAFEQQRLREEQAALYMLYRQKEQELRQQQELERVRRQQEQERLRRQLEQERIRRLREQQQEMYQRRIMEVLEERERRERQEYHQRALINFLFGDEDTDMEEGHQVHPQERYSQQQSEEQPQQQVVQSQQEEPEQEEQEQEEEEEQEHEVSQQEPVHITYPQQDYSTVIPIRFLFSPEASSVASDSSQQDDDDEMMSNSNESADNNDQTDKVSINQQQVSESESESVSGKQDQDIWEHVHDEEKMAETKHLQLRLLGEQLAHLDEKHNSTIPATRLQFADDNSSQVTAISRENRTFLGLEDEVMQVMLQLDGVNSDGDESIRQERKALIRKAEQLLARMDEHKQSEWERISVHSASSA